MGFPRWKVGAFDRGVPAEASVVGQGVDGHDGPGSLPAHARHSWWKSESVSTLGGRDQRARDVITLQRIYKRGEVLCRGPGACR